MKKVLALVLVAVFALCLCACGGEKEEETKAEETSAEVVENPEAEVETAEVEAEETETEETVVEEATKADVVVDVMTYEEFAAAEVDDPVCVETYVQAKQSWWDNKVTVYTQAEDGAYFLYEMACTEEENELLVPGTKIKVSGYKAEWSGEIEIVDAKFEILEADPYIATATDVTDLAASENLINEQNKLVAFKGLKVEAYDDTGAAFAYKNAEEKTDDLYFKASIGDTVLNFCVEFYLTGADSEVYKAVEALEVGQTIDLEGFLYWYEGADAHVTAITVAE